MHSTGPWHHAADNDGAYWIVQDPVTWISRIAKVPAYSDMPNEDNARMLAAAPDLYSALWEVVELSDRTLPPSGRTAECQRVYDLCRAALKRAEGE